MTFKGRTLKKLLPIIAILALIILLASPPAFGQEPPSTGELPMLSDLHPPAHVEETATNEQVTITWQRDPRNIYVAGYRIWRAENSNTFELLELFIPARYPTKDGNFQRESYVDTDVLPGVFYRYRIRSVIEQVMSQEDSWAWATTAADVPPGLGFSASHNRVTLSWDDPEDDTIIGYRILRSVNWGTESIRARSVSATATSWVDRSVSPETAYAYRVQAVRGGQAGPASRYITVLTKARPRSSTSVSERAGRDLPAGTNTTGRLKIGDSVSGTISTFDDVDSFAVDVKAGVGYFIRVRYEGERTDGHGPLRIACVRNDQGERYSRWPGPDNLCPAPSKEAFKGTRDERIYIEVGAAWGEYTLGLPTEYTLEIHADIEEFDPILELGMANQVGEWTSGSFHDQDYEDTYEVDLCGGFRYRIPVFYNAEPATDGRVFQPVAYLQNPTGTGYLYDYTAPLVVKPKGVGKQIYHLEIHREEENPVWGVQEPEPYSYGEGSYRFFVEPLDTGEDVTGLVAVSEAPGTDLPADTSTTGLVPFDQEATGEIGEAGDVDWFMLRFDDRKCERVYWIEMKGADTKDGTLADPFIAGIYDAQGRLIQYSFYGTQADTKDNDSGVDKNALIAFTPSAPGPHYLKVNGNGGATGTYTVTLRDITDTSTSEQDGLEFASWSAPFAVLNRSQGGMCIWLVMGTWIGVTQELLCP